MIGNIPKINPTKPHHYDKMQFVLEKVEPLIKQLFNLCQENDVPLVVAVQGASDDTYDGMMASRVIQDSTGQIPLDMTPRMMAAIIALTYKKEDMPEGFAHIIGLCDGAREEMFQELYDHATAH